MNPIYALPIEDWIRAARVYAAECLPWFAPVLYAAPMHLNESLPHLAGIDRNGRVYFSPHWIAQLYEALQDNVQSLVKHLAYLWYHLLAHWLREHFVRAEAIDAQPTQWNVATDLEISDQPPEGLELPTIEGQPLLVVPNDYQLPGGQIAEWYYRRLQEQTQISQKENGGDESHEQLPKPLFAHHQEQSPYGERPQQGTGRQTTNGQLNGKTWDKGSGVHGQTRPWELPANDPNTHSLNDFDRQTLQEEVAHRILEHHKNRGTLPAGWLRWAQQTLRPKVNWREKLKRMVRGVMSEGFGYRLDYSYRRPHRRSAVYHPIYLPALRGEYKPRIACVVDTSGSIGDRELAHALAEVRGVLEQLRLPVRVILCDALPSEAIRVFHDSDLQKVQPKMLGGGGTDMVAGLKAALQLKPKPEVVIVLTDGYTPFPDRRPRDTTVLWAIWQPGDAKPPQPPIPPWRPRDIIVIPIEPQT